MDVNEPINCSCPCGSATMTVSGKPLFRTICHCTICQRFNDANYADIVVLRAQTVTLPAAGLVVFDAYRPPPNVQRGLCQQCHKPAVEVFKSPLFPRLVMIPSGNFPDITNLPEPALHLFYEHRVVDATDTLPKYRGYMRSQLAFGKHLLGAMLRR